MWLSSHIYKSLQVFMSTSLKLGCGVPKPAGLRVHHGCVVGRRLEVLICVTVASTWERLGGQERTGLGRGSEVFWKVPGRSMGPGQKPPGEIHGPTSATRKLSEREGGWGMEIGVPTSVGLSPR